MAAKEQKKIKKEKPNMQCSAQWFKLFPELGLKVEIPKNFIEELIKKRFNIEEE